MNEKELYLYLQERLKENHFINHVGIKLEKLSIGKATLSLTMEEVHLQQNGFLHGGVTATLCDVATGIAAYTCAPEGKNVVTADLNVRYLNPGVSGNIQTIGTVKKSGNLIFFCEAEVYDMLPDGKKLIATASAIMVAVDIPLRKAADTE